MDPRTTDVERPATSTSRPRAVDESSAELPSDERLSRLAARARALDETPSDPPSEERLLRLAARARALDAPPADPALDERLARVADRATDVLNRWTAANERHERAVTQLEAQLAEFEVTSTRLQREAAFRMQELERSVQQDWAAIREVHEAPIRQLQEHASNLAEVSLATAHSAQRGFDQAEERLQAIEVNLGHQIAELRASVQDLATEVRAGALARVGPASPSAWPLEDVTRLHQQLRQGSGESEVGARALLPGAALTPRGERQPDEASLDEAMPVLRSSSDDAPLQGSGPDGRIERSRVFEQAPNTSSVAAHDAALAVPRRMALWIGGAVAVIVVGLFWVVQSRVDARLAEAQRRSQQIADEATSQITATREQAAREVAAARAVAAEAQIVGAVLASPDLVRYTLTGTGTAATGSAQALWSRTMGFALVGTRLAPPPDGSVYQVWLLTRGDAVSAGTFVPTATGSVAFAVVPPTTQPVVGALVTREPVGGSPRPLGPPVLARVFVTPAT